MQKALSAEKSLQGANFSAQIRAALRNGQTLETPTTETQGAPAPISVAKAEALQRRQTGRDEAVVSFLPPSRKMCLNVHEKTSDRAIESNAASQGK
jgi:hypothetical protein